MYCEWEPFEGKFKCKHCGFIWSKDTFKKQCDAFKKPDDIPKPPGLTKRVQNFTKAAAQHIKTGRRHCTDEQKKTRYEQCSKNECGFFLLHQNGVGVCAHQNCGCFIRSQGKFLDKLSWADSSCPVGLWGPIDENGEETPKKGV